MNKVFANMISIVAVVLFVMAGSAINRNKTATASDTMANLCAVGTDCFTCQLGCIFEGPCPENGEEAGERNQCVEFCGSGCSWEPANCEPWY